MSTQHGISVSIWKVSVTHRDSEETSEAEVAHYSFRQKLGLILKATFQHARNLATFAAVYKSIVFSLRATSSSRKEASLHTFIAGLLGGYVVFGRGIQSSVNQQIVIYVFARVVLALARLSVQKGGAVPRELRERVTNNAWPVFAALSWALVMWLYRWHPQTIQPSLRSSMKYMYGVLALPLFNIFQILALQTRRSFRCQDADLLYTDT